MNAVTRKQPVRSDGDLVRTIVATEHTNEALFHELDPLGKAWDVAKLLAEPRNLRSYDRVRVVRSIRQFGHGDAEQPIEARWLEMNGEVVDPSKDGQARPRARLGTDHRDTRRGVTVISPRAMDAVGVCEGERQKLLRPCRQRDNEWEGADSPGRHAVRPDVRPQQRTRWGHFRLEHLSKPPRAVYRSLHPMPKELRAAGCGVTS